MSLEIGPAFSYLALASWISFVAFRIAYLYLVAVKLME